MKKRLTVFRPEYVDGLGGDHLATLMFCQIEYWYLPDDDGKPKLEICKHGHYWLAKSNVDWWEDLRLTRAQSARCLSLLREKGLIATRVMRFSGVPTMHLRSTLATGRMAPNGFSEAFHSWLVRIQLRTDAQYLTETTAESTTESKDESGVTPLLTSTQIPIQDSSEEDMKTKSSADEILAQHKAKKAAAQGSVKLTATGVYETWCVLAPKYNDGVKFVATFTNAEMGQASRLIKMWGPDSQRVLAHVLQNWVAFTKYSETNSGAYKTPLLPTISFLSKYSGSALNFYLADAANCISDPPKAKNNHAGSKAMVSVTLAPLPQVTQVSDQDDAPMTYADILAYEAKVKPTSDG